jgi:nucleotide-binding universal stress UspA family protein
MSYRTVVTFAGPRSHTACVLETACMLAEPSGRVVVLAGPPVTMQTAHAMAGGAPPPDSHEAELRAAHDLYQRATAARGERRNWRVASQPIDLDLIEASLTADLLVLPNGREPALEIPRIVAGAACSVLLVPTEFHRAPAFRRALIAWNESQSASRAIRGALPLLAKADEVAVMRVCEPDEQIDVTGRTSRVVSWLADHGIDSYGCEMARCETDVSGTLLETAAERGADLLIAGAYGRDWVPLWYGGISARLVRDAPVTCLVAH